ncbi:MAG: hypothetical protein HRT38_00265 [Alteromonadaceae bacterium]|nr:hypothetical protein [Alteromonadaceae bacterium]
MLIKIITLSLSILWLAGCSNAVSYHHSERSSIALEVRATDPQQPVQGIVGVKTRTILVAPGIKDSEAENNGESTSVISDFKLKREANENFFGFGSTIIQSAFITGDAAKNAPPSTAKALSGLGVDGAGDSAIFKRIILVNIYSFLEEKKAKDAKAQEYLDQLDKLLTLLPNNYVNNTYYSLSGNVLQKKNPASYTVKTQGFLEVLNYEQVLVSGSISKLEKMETNRSIKYKASPAGLATDINAADFTMLQGELKRLRAEKKDFFNMIGSHNVIYMAAAYMTSFL